MEIDWFVERYRKFLNKMRAPRRVTRTESTAHAKNGSYEFHRLIVHAPPFQIFITNFNISMVPSPCVLIDQPSQDLAEYAIEIEEKEEDDDNDNEAIDHEHPEIRQVLDITVS